MSTWEIPAILGRIEQAARRGFDHELRGLLESYDAVLAIDEHPHFLREVAQAAAFIGQDRSLDLLFEFGLDEAYIPELHAIASLANRRWATRALSLRQCVRELEVPVPNATCRKQIGRLFVQLLDPRGFVDFDFEERERSASRRALLAERLIRAHSMIPEVMPPHAPAMKVAVRAQADDVVRALLELGAKPTERDSDGRSVLWHAGNGGVPAMFCALASTFPEGRVPEHLREGECLPPVEGVHAPWTHGGDLVSYNDVYENPVIDLMIEAGIPWSLDWACARARADVVEGLLREGTSAAEPNARAIHPLATAAGWEGLDCQREPVVRLLLEAGALEGDDGSIRESAARAARRYRRDGLAMLIEQFEG
ncbi:MAG: hypothetical protein ACK50I_00900 [Burkholderiales bacterium]|jgi:hypothetical protein